MRRKEHQIIETSEIDGIIMKASVCRIAIANEDYPYIVTMNFGYNTEGKKVLYFHCASQGKKLDMISKNNYVCFEMDTDNELVKGEKSCDWGMKFSSVIGYGNITRVSDINEKYKGLNLIMEHYGSTGEQFYDENILEQTTILRLDIIEISGKRKC